MSQLDQIQISFVAGEDRLLLKVSTQNQEEFRCWLTRRFVKAIRPALEQALAAHPRIKNQPDPLAKQELLRFEHEVARHNSDFATPYRGVGRALPLGATPVLLTRGQLRPQNDGGVILTLAPDNGGGIDLAFNPTLLHSFMVLLDQTLLATDWDLAAGLPAVESTPATSSIN
jgi:hypothetical protein